MNPSEHLSGAQVAIRALADADADAWLMLLDHAVANEGEPAPPAFVSGLLAADPDLEAWMQRAKCAAALVESDHFTTVAAAMRSFHAWLLPGIEGAHAPGSPLLTAARFVRLQDAVGDDVYEQPQAFVAGMTDDAPSTALRPRALVFLAQPALEHGSPDVAVAAAAEAETRSSPGCSTAPRRPWPGAYAARRC